MPIGINLIPVSTFKSVALGDTGDIWTPAKGKRFQLIGWIINIPQDALANPAGEITIQFRDGATLLPIIYRDYFPISIPTNASGDIHHGVTLPYPGIVSAASDNVLSVVFSAALASGLIQFNVMGAER